jgi:hypothetical protein
VALRKAAERRVEGLRGVPAKDRVTALSDALAVCDEAEVEPLALALVELALVPGGGVGRSVLSPGRIVEELSGYLRQPVCNAALIELGRRWGRLPEGVRRAAAAAGLGRWHLVAEALGVSSVPATRAALARLAADVGDPALLAGALRLLADKDRAVAEAADRAILTHAVGCLGESLAQDGLSEWSGRSIWPAERAVIERVAAEAAWTTAGHGRRGCLLAAAVLIHDRPQASADQERLRRLLEQGGSEPHAQLKTLLRRTPSALLRERALRWCTIPAMAGVCVERVATADTVGDHAAVLASAHLVLRPERARRLGLVRVRAVRRNGEAAMPASGAVPDAAGYAALGPEQRRMVPRWVGVLDLDEASRRVALAPTLGDADALTRMLAAAAVPMADLVEYCFDAEPAVARGAMIRWSAAGTRVPGRPTPARAYRAEMLGKLRRSPHAAVRACAAQDLASVDPWRAEEPASRLAARRWLKEDQSGFLAAVRERLGHGDAGLRAGAAMVVRKLELVPRFEFELARAAGLKEGAGEPGALRVAATAVAALGDVRTEAARRAVRGGLDAPDDRVRANAVEAMVKQAGVGGGSEGDLAQADSAVWETLVELKRDPAHRVRANALRGLLAAGTGAAFERAATDELARMLEDGRVAHRTAAVWLVERVLSGGGRARVGPVWADLARQIAERAEHDPDPGVRMRAVRCARVLLGEIRQGERARVREGLEVAA